MTWVDISGTTARSCAGKAKDVLLGLCYHNRGYVFDHCNYIFGTKFKTDFFFFKDWKLAYSMFYHGAVKP